MSFSIFCPSNHLILDATTCPVCGWNRPHPPQSGQPLWPPVKLPGMIKPLGHHTVHLPGLARNTIVYHQWDGRLVGVRLSDGTVAYEKPLPAKSRIYEQVTNGEHILAAVCDERQHEEAEGGYLASIDPLSGELALLWRTSFPAGILQNLRWAGDTLVLCDSSQGILGFDRRDLSKPAWLFPRGTGKPWDISIHRDTILAVFTNISEGKSYLQAVSMQGKGFWSHLLEGQSFLRSQTVIGEVFVYANSDHQLCSLDLETRKPRWAARKFPYIYANLAAGEEEIYLAVRGEKDPAAAGHYQLVAIHPADGAENWRVPIPDHLVSLQLFENFLLMGTNKGELKALDLQTRQVAWSHNLGNREDPIISPPLLDQGIWLASTYSGKILAVQLAPQPVLAEDVGSYLAREEWENAAAWYALHNQWSSAAEIFAEKIGAPVHASFLYEKTGNLQSAGDQALKAGMYTEALHDYELAGDLYGQVRVCELTGNSLEAARRLLSAGKKREAAPYFEQGGELRTAMELYKAEGAMQEYERLRAEVPYDHSDLEILLQQEKFTQALQLALQLQKWEKALELAEQLEDKRAQYEALRSLAQAAPEIWVWMKLAPLACELEEYLQAAEAWEKQGQNFRQQAAEAYQKAAEQFERQGEDLCRQAEYYQKAHKHYDELGLQAEALACRRKVLECNRWPQIHLSYTCDNIWKANRSNRLTCRVKNIGFGTAHQIKIALTPPDPEDIKVVSFNEVIAHLAAGTSNKEAIRFLVTPKMAGSLLMKLSWQWECPDHVEVFQESLVINIDDVREEDDSRPINIEKIEVNSGGVLSQSEYTHIGNKAEINRYASPPVTAVEPIPAKIQCPNCCQDTEPGEYCNKCGSKLPD